MSDEVAVSATNDVPSTTTKKTRTVRPGFSHVYVEITDEQKAELSDLAVADDRKGGAAEMLSVLVKRNLPALIAAAKKGE